MPYSLTMRSVVPSLQSPRVSAGLAPTCSDTVFLTEVPTAKGKIQHACRSPWSVPIPGSLHAIIIAIIDALSIFPKASAQAHQQMDSHFPWEPRRGKERLPLPTSAMLSSTTPNLADPWAAATPC